MSIYLERAKGLRISETRHYNCAQSVLVPFADVLGMEEEKLYNLGTHFGSGMRMGATCGAITGALMVLGLAGADDSAALQKLYGTLRENHDGLMNCADLLRVNKEKGGEKKKHCDDMVYECTALAEEILRERNIITE